MYELIILSILLRSPAHGYLIAKLINNIFGPYARVSNGRLYPLLAKLEAVGLIVVDADATQVTQPAKGERQLRSYRISEDGRRRFHRLMMDTTSNPGEYQRIFIHKVSALEFLQPAERLYLIDHYINYSQAHVLHLIAEQEELADNKYIAQSLLKANLDVIQHVTDQWRLEVTWALRLRQMLVAAPEAGAGEKV